jgi:hypothetical protein
MRRAAASLCLLVVVLLTATCASTVPLQSNFWNRKGATVVVALATLPEAHAHRLGSEMLLDLAINKSLAQKLDTRMREVAPTLLKSVTDSFVKRLQERGFVAKKAGEPMAVDALQNFSASRGQTHPFGRDVRPLAQKYNADMLLLITVQRYGTLRKYYGFIPLGAPKALFDVRGQMIDLKTNELLWQTSTSDDQATVAVEGEWSEPPDYRNLVAALEKAVPQSMAHLERQFFAAAP